MKIFFLVVAMSLATSLPSSARDIHANDHRVASSETKGESNVESQNSNSKTPSSPKVVRSTLVDKN